MEVPSIPLSPAEARRRARENETAAQRIKREKAAERQRRKRERDRAGLFPSSAQANSNNSSNGGLLHDGGDMQAQEQQYSLTPEEEARRDRVRAAARERQRKHRALVKSRKMRDIGGTSEEYTGGGGGGQGSDTQTTAATDEQSSYHQVLAELSGPHPDFQPPPQPAVSNGGQTFATTLLLSFSCSPMLKTHLLRTLNMTNDELTSFEPIIAEAWERWNIARQGGFPPPMEGAMEGMFQPNGGEDFRTRFHRPLVAPTPFQQQEIDPSLKTSE